MDERLWSLIDGTASAEEASTIKMLLESDAAWNARYQELLGMHQSLQLVSTDAPSLRFAKNVMEEITRLHIVPVAKTYLNKKIIWGIGIFFVLILLGVMLYSLALTDTTESQDDFLIRNLDKLEFSKMLNDTWVKVLLMINALLGLFLLDVYLNRKRKIFRQKA